MTECTEREWRTQREGRGEGRDGMRKVGTA
jgi:hypothetical protein